MLTGDIVTPFPAAATDTAWKAAKTEKLRDKWNTELGAALRAAEAAYNRINFELLDLQYRDRSHERHDVVADLDAAKHAAEAHYNTVVKPAITLLAAAKTKADAAGRNLIITKASNQKARQIAVVVGQMLTLLKSFKYRDFDTRRANLEKNLQFAYDNFDRHVNDVLDRGDAFVKLVRKTPTPAVFNRGIQDAARDITQTIGNLDKLKRNGLDLHKPDPAHLVAPLEEWGQGRDRLPVTANRVRVLKTISDYEGYVQDVRDWLG